MNITSTILAQPAGAIDAINSITYDQEGATNENAPDADAVSNGSLGAHANVLPFTTQYSTRQYYRFAQPIKEFKSISFSNLIFFGRAPRTHSLLLSFITDSSLDLNSVTWNNQAALTYEDIVAITPLLTFDTPVGDAANVVTVGVYWQSPWDSYNLVSGSTAYGCRLMYSGDTAYAIGEEASQAGDNGVTIYY